MKRSLLLLLAVALCGVFTGCEPPLQTGINIDNLNGPPYEDTVIRVWVLSEEEIQNPPTTREEAEAVYNYVTYPSNYYRFLETPGTYFVVASNETHFQSLAPTDAFTPGFDFSLLEVEVTESGFLDIGVENTNTPTLLPEITEL